MQHMSRVNYNLYQPVIPAQSSRPTSFRWFVKVLFNIVQLLIVPCTYLPFFSSFYLPLIFPVVNWLMIIRCEVDYKMNPKERKRVSCSH